MYLGVLMYIDFALWMIVPILYNIKDHAFTSNGTVRLQTCMYMIMPFDYERNIRNWVFMHIINIYLAGFGCTVFVVADTIMYGIMFHLLGRIDILKHHMKTLYSKVKNIPDKQIKNILRICVRDHVTIIRLIYFFNIEYIINTSVSLLLQLNFIQSKCAIVFFKTSIVGMMVVKLYDHLS